MHIEKIKYFIDLVECRNFTDTARKNFVSQTTISQQIASLEKEFAVQLIDRNLTPVEPTKAGWLFYSEAKILWKQYNQMKQKMEHYQKGYPKVLTIEYAAVTDIERLLRLIPEFKIESPDTRIDLDKVLLKDIAEYLEKGVYDMAIAFDSEFIGKEHILTKTLYQGKYCAVAHRNHPLFGAEVIKSSELYAYPLVMLNPTTIGNSYYLMVQRAVEEGYEPNIKRTVDDVETEFFYIVTENLIGFFPDNYSLPYLNSEVRLIPLEDTHHTFEIVVAYLKENSNEALHSFLHMVHNSIIQ